MRELAGLLVVSIPIKRMSSTKELQEEANDFLTIGFQMKKRFLVTLLLLSVIGLSQAADTAPAKQDPIWRLTKIAA